MKKDPNLCHAIHIANISREDQLKYSEFVDYIKEHGGIGYRVVPRALEVMYQEYITGKKSLKDLM